MAEVRASSGVPVAAAFVGYGAPTPCAPVIVDSVTGYLYTLKSDNSVIEFKNATTGYTGTITTASLVGKTITVANGVITGFA